MNSSLREFKGGVTVEVDTDDLTLYWLFTSRCFFNVFLCSPMKQLLCCYWLHTITSADWFGLLLCFCWRSWNIVSFRSIQPPVTLLNTFCSQRPPGLHEVPVCHTVILRKHCWSSGLERSNGKVSPLPGQSELFAEMNGSGGLDWLRSSPDNSWSWLVTIGHFHR